jgi:hypothetical protein
MDYMKSSPEDFSEMDSFAARHHHLQILVENIEIGPKMSQNLFFFSRSQVSPSLIHVWQISKLTTQWLQEGLY